MLAARINQPDLADLPDWHVAEILNTPDDTLPPVVTVVDQLVGVGTFMSALGADAGAAFLDSLEALAASSPRVRWAVWLIKNGDFNLGDDQVRAAIAEFAAAGLLTQAQASVLLARAENVRLVSWAEHHGIDVTPRTVGLARGAV